MSLRTGGEGSSRGGRLLNSTVSVGLGPRYSHGVNVQTYLYFAGCCREAIELYERAIGAEVLHVTRYGDVPGAGDAPEKRELVFHATIRIGETLLNLSDDPGMDGSAFGGFALLVHVDAPEALDTAFEMLAAGGRVVVPIQATLWANRYAIVTDRFGVTWKLQYSG